MVTAGKSSSRQALSLKPPLQPLQQLLLCLLRCADHKAPERKAKQQGG